MTFDTVEQAIDAVRRGEFVVVVDDEDRENEGDLIIAAEKMTPDKMAFMIRYTSGVICLPMEGERLDELQLPLMVSGIREHRGPAHRVHGLGRRPARHDDGHLGRRPVHDRARAASTRDDGRRPRPPGPHLPAALPRGRRAEAGRPHRGRGRPRPAWRAAIPAGVLAEIVNDDGTMQRMPDLEQFAAEHGLVLVTIADLIRYRRHREKLVRRVSEARIPTQYGDFTAHVFESLLDGTEHLAFVRGEVSGKDERARARALRVPHRRRVRLVALRLRRAARPRARTGRGARAKASSSTCAGTKAAASASATSCARTRCRTRAATRSRRTSSSASRPTRASTASARRSSSTSASPRCG